MTLNPTFAENTSFMLVYSEVHNCCTGGHLTAFQLGFLEESLRSYRLGGYRPIDGRRGDLLFQKCVHSEHHGRDLKPVVELLLRYGVTSRGHQIARATVLHHVVEKNRTDLLHLFLRYRSVDVDHPDDEGKAALVLAVSKGQWKIAQELIQRACLALYDTSLLWRIHEYTSEVWGVAGMRESVASALRRRLISHACWISRPHRRRLMHHQHVLLRLPSDLQRHIALYL